ncbi:MAG: DUF3857 domain-containing protein, partial [Bacteroidota bacterium]
VHDNLDVKKFTMPNVKEGSIIEVKYSVASDYYWTMSPWYFQEVVPTKYSEYNIEVPEFFTFNKNFIGYFAPHVKPRESTAQGDSDYEVVKEGWVMENLPAFESEDYMRSYKNYISRIDFELESIQAPSRPTEYFTKSWENIRDDLWKSDYFGMPIKRSKTPKMIAKEFLGDNNEERMIAIYEHIKNKMKWDGENSKYVDKGIKKSWKEGNGNSAEINLTLLATLRAAGFDASPVVLSTRSNGMLPLMFPSADKLNYVISKVDIGEKTYYLDATDDFCPAGVLPYKCFNGEAVILGKKELQQVLLKPSQKLKSATQSTLSLDKDGTLEGVVKKTKTGYAAINFRKKYARSNSEDDLLEKLENEAPGLSIESHKFEGLNNIYEGLKEEYEVVIEEKAEVTGNMIYINPMLNNALTENPFKLEVRKYPVDYAIPIEETYMLKLEIPDGYAVETLPEISKIALPEKAGQFSYSAKMVGGEIMVLSRLRINKTLFLEDEYALLKQFYNIIVKKHAEQIVLKKI